MHRRHAYWDIELAERVRVGAATSRVHEFFGHAQRRARVRREPIGVVGAITPWNFPFMLNLSKIVPALAAGNTVVLKPAPDTPWSATCIGKLAAEHTDIPRRRAERRHVGAIRPRSARCSPATRASTSSRFTGSTAVGQAHHGARADDAEEGLPRARRQVGATSCSTTPTSRRCCPAARWSACTRGQGCAITTRLLAAALALRRRASSC